VRRRSLHSGWSTRPAFDLVIGGRDVNSRGLKRVGFLADLHVRALDIVSGKLTLGCLHFDLGQLRVLGLTDLTSGEGDTQHSQPNKCDNVAHDKPLWQSNDLNLPRWAGPQGDAAGNAAPQLRSAFFYFEFKETADAGRRADGLDWRPATYYIAGLAAAALV
jgi:hypothetical protein